MNTLSQRIRFLMDSTTPKTKSVELARACGIKPPSVADWLNGNTKKLEGNNLLQLASFFKCNQIWLATGKGSPFIEKEITTSVKTAKKETDDVLISQFDAAGAMGSGLVLQDRAGIIGGWNVSREWLKLNVPYCSSISNLAIVTGFGDSMKGMFNPGDPLLIDTGIKSLDSDGVYFFRVGNEGFIKRLQRIPGDGILVASSNKEYRDWFIKPEMDFEIFGRVLKAWEGKGF